MSEVCYSGLRFVFIVFNVLLFLCSCGILSFGIYVIMANLHIAGVPIPVLFTPASLAVSAGCTLLASCIGCVGAIRKRKKMLWLFLKEMGIIVLVSITPLILATVYREKLKNELEGDMISSLKEFEEEGKDYCTDRWNRMQRKFQCCGVNGTRLWYIHYTKARGRHTVVPDSCCVIENKDCGNPYRYANGTFINGIYAKGCFNEVKDFLENHLLIMGILASVFLVIELVAMILAFMLISHSKSNSV